MAGQVPLGIVTASSAAPLIAAGKLRALAVTSPKRSPLLPQVATVAEQGVKDYALDQWHGLLAPAATPPAVIDRINVAVARIMQRRTCRWPCANRVHARHQHASRLPGHDPRRHRSLRGADRGDRPARRLTRGPGFARKPVEIHGTVATITMPTAIEAR